MKKFYFIFLLALFFSVHAQADDVPSSADTSLVSTNLSADQIRRFEQLTTAFENSTIVFQYDYIENLKDGRGFTAGRVGFCTGTGDLIQVVTAYTKLKPENNLTPYIPELQRLNALQLQGKPGAGVTTGLPGFENAWKLAAKDPLFCQAQDDIVNILYLDPALNHAAQIGVKSALGQGFIYDTIIQHGDGDDPDGLSALIQTTTTLLHGSPASGVDEKTWIAKFMDVRRADLMNAHDRSTRKAWRESVDRVDSYQRIMATGNWDLDGPIHFTVYGGAFTVP